MYVDWCECTVWTCVRGWAGFLSAIWNTAHAAWAVSCPQLGLLLRLLLLLLHVPHQSLPDDVLQTQITGWIAKRVVSRVYTACKTNIYAHIGNTENQVKCLTYNKHKQKMQVLIFYGEINPTDDVVKLTWCCYCWEIEDLCAWLSITCWANGSKNKVLIKWQESK